MVTWTKGQVITGVEDACVLIVIGDALALFNWSGLHYSTGPMFSTASATKHLDISCGYHKQGGDYKAVTPGRGLILTSPDGTVQKRLYLTNAGALDVEDV